MVGICRRNTLKSTIKVGMMPKVLRDFIPGMVFGGMCSRENFLRRRLPASRRIVRGWKRPFMAIAAEERCRRP